MNEILKRTLPDGVLMAVRGYAVCPHCINNDEVDHIGDEDHPAGWRLSHWECEGCGTTFSVFDEHEDYTKHGWLGEDHYDFYYTLDDVEWGGGALRDRRVRRLFAERFPTGSDGPGEDFDIADLYIQAHEDLDLYGSCYHCGNTLPPDGRCICEDN